MFSNFFSSNSISLFQSPPVCLHKEKSWLINYKPALSRLIHKARLTDSNIDYLAAIYFPQKILISKGMKYLINVRELKCLEG